MMSAFLLSRPLLHCLPQQDNKKQKRAMVLVTIHVTKLYIGSSRYNWYTIKQIQPTFLRKQMFHILYMYYLMYFRYQIHFQDRTAVAVTGKCSFNNKYHMMVSLESQRKKEKLSCIGWGQQMGISIWFVRKRKYRQNRYVILDVLRFLNFSIFHHGSHTKVALMCHDIYETYSNFALLWLQKMLTPFSNLVQEVWEQARPK